MHAADDYDGSGNVDDDGRRGNERWSDCLPAYHLNDAASLGLPTLGGRRVLSRGAKRAGRYY